MLNFFFPVVLVYVFLTEIYPSISFTEHNLTFWGEKCYINSIIHNACESDFNIYLLKLFTLAPEMVLITLNPTVVDPVECMTFRKQYINLPKINWLCLIE
jgi:hypothetical protein